jgi:uncharacterized protein (DUF488 family)
MIYGNGLLGGAPHMTIYTVGHSNIAIEGFVDLLRLHMIQLLADTRSQPYSRYAPQFNRKSLKSSLEYAGIAYLYLGDELGGRPRDARYYRPEGTVDYDQLAEALFYREGIERLKREATGRCLAVMCSEADYKNCHRYKLITRSLVKEGVEVHHILHSGGLAPTDLNDFHSELRQLGLPFE